MNCIYCNKVMLDGESIEDHVKICEKHPIRGIEDATRLLWEVHENWANRIRGSEEKILNKGMEVMRLLELIEKIKTCLRNNNSASETNHKIAALIDKFEWNPIKQPDSEPIPKKDLPPCICLNCGARTNTRDEVCPGCGIDPNAYKKKIVGIERGD